MTDPARQAKMYQVLVRGYESEVLNHNTEYSFAAYYLVSTP
jgi:hypothetical protein